MLIFRMRCVNEWMNSEWRWTNFQMCEKLLVSDLIVAGDETFPPRVPARSESEHHSCRDSNYCSHLRRFLPIASAPTNSSTNWIACSGAAAAASPAGSYGEKANTRARVQVPASWPTLHLLHVLQVHSPFHTPVFQYKKPTRVSRFSDAKMGVIFPMKVKYLMISKLFLFERSFSIMQVLIRNSSKSNLLHSWNWSDRHSSVLAQF